MSSAINPRTRGRPQEAGTAGVYKKPRSNGGPVLALVSLTERMGGHAHACKPTPAAREVSIVDFCGEPRRSRLIRSFKNFPQAEVEDALSFALKQGLRGLCRGRTEPEIFSWLRTVMLRRLARERQRAAKVVAANVVERNRSGTAASQTRSASRWGRWVRERTSSSRDPGRCTDSAVLLPALLPRQQIGVGARPPEERKNRALARFLQCAYGDTIRTPKPGR